MLARDFARGFIQAANPRVATPLGGTRVMVDQRAQMSALGQKRTSRPSSSGVRLVPIADILTFTEERSARRAPPQTSASEDVLDHVPRESHLTYGQSGSHRELV